MNVLCTIHFSLSFYYKPTFILSVSLSFYVTSCSFLYFFSLFATCTAVLVSRQFPSSGNLFISEIT